MVIRECGILFRGFTLVYESYHKTAGEEIDNDLRSGLITAFLAFAKTAFAKNLVEYFEMNKFIIAFIEDKIMSRDNSTEEPEVLITYAILDKEKKIDKYISKVVIPRLEEITKKFKAKYEGKTLSEMSQFIIFKDVIKDIWKEDIKTVDQRLKGPLF